MSTALPVYTIRALLLATPTLPSQTLRVVPLPTLLNRLRLLVLPATALRTDHSWALLVTMRLARLIGFRNRIILVDLLAATLRSLLSPVLEVTARRTRPH